jgi:hypothetical protein
MANQNLISLYPNGVISSLAELRAVDIAYTPNNSTVRVLGSGSAGDTYAATYRYVAASTDSDNGRTVIEPTSSTGAWLEVNPFSGRYLVTTSITGFQEDAIIFSGNSSITYTLPPVGAREGKKHLIKQCGTGVLTVTGATANQPIFDQTCGVSLVFQGGSGASYQFLAANGIYYTTNALNF